MSDPASRLPARPSLEQLRKQAKDLLRAYHDGDASAIERLRRQIPRLARATSTAEPDVGISLADAQFVLAREHGFENWARLASHVAFASSPRVQEYEALAQELAAAYTTGDYTAIREMNWRRGTAFVWDREPARMQARLLTWSASDARTPDLALADTRRMVARMFGAESWVELMASLKEDDDAAGSSWMNAARGESDSAVPLYRYVPHENVIEVRRPLSDREWDRVFAVMREQRITGLASPTITDAAMARLAELDHVTRLSFDGSTSFTDDGLLQLARMPQLQVLDLSGWRSPITDRGLEVLRHLPELRGFQMCWPQGVSDAGVANLTFCDHLERVDLLGTQTGDGAINALAGKRSLRHLKTGRLVTDAGLPLLHGFPAFKAWLGGEPQYHLMAFDAGPTHLLVDGPFTRAGLARLAGLEGLFGLSFFSHTTALTPSALGALAGLPNLGFLGCDGRLCDDEAMRHIAAIPRLRMLMGQGAVATDDGFVALSRSRTIEYIWGRECPNLTGRGFAALGDMPALTGLAVSCLKVDDAALATLPRFPSLTALMPMDVTDDGFRHVGRCERLEDLCCMYCRSTGDVATSHIAGLTKLRSYYAGDTEITDRSLETLGTMASLEKLSFWQCKHLTNAGVAALAKLPRLREVSLDGLPGVTRDAAKLFPSQVRVSYSG